MWAESSKNFQKNQNGGSDEPLARQLWRFSSSTARATKFSTQLRTTASPILSVNPKLKLENTAPPLRSHGLKLPRSSRTMPLTIRSCRSMKSRRRFSASSHSRTLRTVEPSGARPNPCSIRSANRDASTASGPWASPVQAIRKTLRTERPVTCPSAWLRGLQNDGPLPVPRIGQTHGG